MLDTTQEILIGDCRDILKTLPEKSVHCCVTSPPYFNLRRYLPKDHPDRDKEVGSEQTPEEYVNNLVEIFREVKRVLQDSGSVWINISDSYTGGGRGGDPKHKKDSNSAEATYPSYKGLPSKNLIGIPFRVAFALQADGWYWRDVIIWEKGNCMPSSVKDRTTTSHEYILLFSKSKKYFYDNEAIKEPNANPDRKNYVCGSRSNGMNRDRNDNDMVERSKKFTSTGRNKRSVWHVNTVAYKASHFATFPPKLITPCILAGTSEHGVCSECSAPYIREIEKTGNFQRRWSTNNSKNSPYNAQESMQNTYETVDWKPSCSCNALVMLL